MTAQQLLGIDLGPLQQVANMASIASGGMPLGSLFCPGSASAFTLHFQSDLDSYFWRDVIPVELLYPASWVPFLDEVSSSPLISSTRASGRPPSIAISRSTYSFSATSTAARESATWWRRSSSCTQARPGSWICGCAAAPE